MLLICRNFDFFVKGEVYMSTIAAISTAQGNAGIGIIRMSGEKCFEILEKIFVPKNNKSIERIFYEVWKYNK